MSRFARHFFVCTNARPIGGKPACGPRGGDAIFAALQHNLVAHPEICDRVSVSSVNCLGPCFEGPVVVCYPEGTWYARVNEADANELAREHLVGGRAVARLVHDWTRD